MGISQGLLFFLIEKSKEKKAGAKFTTILHSGEGVLEDRRRAKLAPGKARARSSHGAGTAAHVPNAFEEFRLAGFEDYLNNERGVFLA